MSARSVPFSALPTATLTDALGFIADNLRDADEDEVRASLPGDPKEAIMASAVVSSLGWLLLDRTGLPMGVCGVAPSVAPGVGMPWLVGTEGLHQEAFALARQTRAHVEAMHEWFPVLTNHVDARNDLALDWLLWAGFRLIDADPRYGPEERLFLQFYKSR